MPRGRKLKEGDPVAPIPAFVSAGLHERDVYIAAAIASATNAWTSGITPEQIADRAIAIADAVMERKELSK